MYHVPPKVFGCVCFVHDVSPGRDKLSARAIKCVFLGYSRLQKGYKCYSPSTKRHYMSTDVTFFEETMFFTKDDCDSIQQALPIPYLSPTESSSLETHNQEILQPSFSVHSQAELSPPSIYHHLSPSYFSFVSSVSSITIPKFVCEALDHPGWRQAMIFEIGTWELVPLPLGKKVVGCRWGFVIKVAPNGIVDCLKAWFVAKEYTQVYGLEYGDTFSLVAITTIYLLFAMAVIHHWPLH
ncbi:hypothetical protein CR513_33831, partial [Mucuna pruriens]